MLKDNMQTSIQGLGLIAGYSGFWLARSEGMDPYSSPYITHCSSFHFLSHSFIPKGKENGP